MLKLVKFNIKVLIKSIVIKIRYNKYIQLLIQLNQIKHTYIHTFIHNIQFIIAPPAQQKTPIQRG